MALRRSTTSQLYGAVEASPRHGSRPQWVKDLPTGALLAARAVSTPRSAAHIPASVPRDTACIKHSSSAIASCLQEPNQSYATLSRRWQRSGPLIVGVMSDAPAELCEAWL